MRGLVCFVLLLASVLAFGSDLVIYHVMNAGSKGLYEAKCNYPIFENTSSVARLANLEIKNWASRQQAAFLKECKDFFNTSKEKPIAPWTQTIESTVAFYNLKSISVRIRVDSYTGGAHPVYEDTVFNYGIVNGKVKRIVLDDLFLDRSASRKLLSALLIKKLKATGNAAWLEDGTVKNLEPAQLNRFVVGTKSLKFLFNPYEVGPWAVGNFEIPVTFQELGPGFKKSLFGL